MSIFKPAHFRTFAVMASGAMLLLAGTALAQPVQVFDDAPSIEQLRSIMVPEAHTSVSRSIVIQRPDTSAPSTSVQQVATQAVPAQRTPPARPIVHASAAPKQPTDSNAVAFHINFAFNSATLPDSAHEMIDLIAQLMKETPEIKVRVEGHTDAAGAADYNLALSQRRALSVGEYLVKLGIDPSRLQLIGKGMSEPLTPNRYDPANRRVQFVRVS